MQLKTFITLGVACVALAILGPVSHAAVVTWNAPTQIDSSATSDMDVSTTGTLFSAVNFGDASTATVNGVGFVDGTGTSFDGGNVSLSFVGAQFTFGALSPATSGNTDYDALLNVSRAAVTSGVLTFNNLTIGQDYQVQFWANDSRNISGVFGRTTTVQDGDGGSVVTLLQNSSGIGSNLGQYALGDFTATATSQVLNLGGSAGPGITAVQLRSVTAVPEPSSLALIAIGLGFAGVRSRKRSSKVR